MGHFHLRVDTLERLFGRGRGPGPPAAPRDPLDEPLLRLSDRDYLTARHAVEGLLAVGSTGSGKTSGFGRAVGDAVLGRGWGGVVLCVKPGEAAEWTARVRAAGRGADLVLFGPDHPAEFNPLRREVELAGPGGDATEQVVGLLAQLDELTDPGAAKGHEDAFFRAASRDCLRSVVGLLVLAGEPVTVANLYDVIATAPTDPRVAARPDLLEQRYTGQLLRAAGGRATDDTLTRFRRVQTYFLHRYPGFPDKTRAGVVEGLVARLSALSSGPLERLFGRGMTWTPDAVYAGAVTVVDCPALRYGEAGRLTTCLFKCAFTRDVQRRTVGPDTPPVFLWCDEFQYVLTSSDVMYLTTARSARCATVVITQNVSTLTAVLGGDGAAEAFVHSLLGNLRTKVFHAVEEPRTCEYLANLVGHEFAPVPSWTVPTGGEGDRDRAGAVPTATAGLQRVYRLEPTAVQGLKTGGPANGHRVEAVVFRGGQPFADGKTYLKVAFDQRTGGVV